MGVLNTLLSPNFCAKVAASRKTPPNRPPTSWPYNRHSLCFAISSSIANKAQSTITTFSPPSGERSPTSSVIGVGAKSCVNKSSGLGSSAFNASFKLVSTSPFTRETVSSNTSSENPFSRNSFHIFGYGSRLLASSKSSRYHSILTPEV